MAEKYCFSGDLETDFYELEGTGIIQIPEGFVYDRYGRPLNVRDPVVLDNLVNNLKVGVADTHDGLCTTYYFLRFSEGKNPKGVIGRSFNPPCITVPWDLLSRIGLAKGEDKVCLTGVGGEAFHVWSVGKRGAFYNTGINTGAVGKVR